jgi:uncharacterized protein (DUF433 family)
VSEQTTLIITANVEGHTISSAESRTYRGSLEPPPRQNSWLGSVPGIVLRDGPAGRRAVVSGTGLDVWEIIATWREVGESFERLQAAYHWLSEEQLWDALEYYKRNADEIEARLAREQELTPEAVWERFPYTRPPS